MKVKRSRITSRGMETFLVGGMSLRLSCSVSVGKVTEVQIVEPEPHGLTRRESFYR